MALFGKQNKCVNCKKKLPANANFCPYCGAAQPGGLGKCPQCGSVVASDARFCPHCGYQLSDAVDPVMEGRRWAKGPDDFAVRVEVDDVPGFFRKDVIVEPGTRALMLVDGQNIAGELGPGKYTLQSAGLFSAKTATAILVDSGDTDLQFTVPELFTSDPLRITMDCRLVARVDNVVMFLTNMMKGQRTVPLSRLRQYLFDEIQNAASEAVGRHSVQELNSNLALKEELAMDIEAHLNRTFQRMGLRFDRVRTLNFRHEHWDEVVGAKADLFLQISKEEALAQGRKRLADVLHEKELQEIIEEERKVERYEQRAKVWARMRRAVASDRMDEVRTEEEFASFLRGIDRQRILDENELEELKREFRERKEDHDLARAHILSRTRLEQEYELKMLELARRRDLTLDQIGLEQEVERRRVEGRLGIEERQFATQLDRRRREAQLQAELEELERKGDEADAELGLRLLREMKAIRREEAEQAQELQLQAEERRLEMELRRFREEREADLARIQTLSQLSTEALIAVSGAEQARLLAELRRTETLRGMSEEQILALAAEKSPEVARAFQEKFRALSTEEQKTMYERLVQAEKASKDEQAKLWRDTMQTLERMFEKAVQTQAETATAFARGQQAPTVVVTPGGGQTVVGGGAGEGGSRMIVCRNCGAESPVGTKYCKNCGEAFYD